MSVLLFACASSQDSDAVKAEKIALKGLDMCNGLTGTDDIDSLNRAVELFSQAIEVNPDTYESYFFKALVLCRLKRFDDALQTLSQGQKSAYASKADFMLYSYEAMIQEYLGDTVTANLNYERTIEYIDYRIKKTSKDDHYYMAMTMNRIILLVLRYGVENAADEIAALKSRDDYTEGSGLWALVDGLENFDKERYMSTILGIIPTEKLSEEELKRYEETMWNRK